MAEAEQLAEALNRRLSRHAAEFGRYGISTDVPVHLMRAWITGALREVNGQATAAPTPVAHQED